MLFDDMTEYEVFQEWPVVFYMRGQYADGFTRSPKAMGYYQKAYYSDDRRQRVYRLILSVN